ncbi:kinase-like domain-containing protein [Armillaria borealis]|uniref:Kinase-like domain-containing protein n=1 Tax=Armillaria borealis TaxID=47425 RepID=A0AA39MX58_9AGAR|nr:kinase-like domain-containing protein [Armillaria borealis]
MSITDNPLSVSESTTLSTRSSLPNWTQINLNEETGLRTRIQGLIRDAPRPWKTMTLISPAVEIMVMDVLQQELDDARPDGCRTACMKCLRTLSKARNIVPSSFYSQDVTREGTNPVGGGGFADIWKGRLLDIQVCLKVLRLFTTGKDREKLLREFFSKDLFAPSYCLISPWMINGNIMSYLEAHPDHDRLISLVQVAEGMKYLHNHDPPIVHADIRGANILVMDDLRCCLADFGLSLFAGSQTLDISSFKGTIRWLAPEYMDLRLFSKSYITARDIYAYGCTVVEVFTGKPPFSDIKYDAGVIHEVTMGKRPPRPPSNVFPDNKLWLLVMACLTTLPSRRPNARQILAILAKATFGNGSLQGDVSSTSNSDLILIKPSEESNAIDNTPSLASRKGSPTASFASDTGEEYTHTRRSLSSQTVPFSGKRRRSLSF